MPDIDIIIVNWNSGPHLSACLASIPGAAGSVNFKVVIVDNASSDDSLTSIKSSPITHELVQNSLNLGFAAACNIGAQCCSAPVILFLNPDVVLARCAIEIAYKELQSESDPRRAVVGIKLRTSTGEVWRTCARLPTSLMVAGRGLGLHKLSSKWWCDYVMSDWDHLEDRDVDHVIGAFYLIKRPVFSSMGGFDERFFVYLEDLDLSLRIRRQGLTIHYSAKTDSMHAGGGSSANAKSTAIYYSLKSRLLFARKHFATLGAAAVFATTLAGDFLIRTTLCVLTLDAAGVKQTIGIFTSLWREANSCWQRGPDASEVAKLDRGS